MEGRGGGGSVIGDAGGGIYVHNSSVGFKRFLG